MTQSSPLASPILVLGTEQSINLFASGSQIQSGSVPATGNPNPTTTSEAETTVSPTGSGVGTAVKTFTVLPPGSSSPLITNGASVGIRILPTVHDPNSKPSSLPPLPQTQAASPPPTQTFHHPPPLSRLLLNNFVLKDINLSLDWLL